MINITEQKKNVLVDSITWEGDYGFERTAAIIDHKKHGRILITDGFGGMDQLCGGMVRWSHGMAIKLQPMDASIDELENKMWNYHMTLLEAILAGQDETRPILLNIHPMALGNIAKSVGL